jgi:hypothetical protein
MKYAAQERAGRVSYRNTWGLSKAFLEVALGASETKKDERPGG